MPDINECNEGIDDCPGVIFCQAQIGGTAAVCGTSDECINTVGSFDCVCATGFTGDGHTCNGEQLFLATVLTHYECKFYAE